MKKYLGLGVIVVAVIVMMIIWGNRGEQANDVKNSQTISGGDPANTIYIIDGKEVALVGGVAEEPAAPGASSTTRTAIFGEPVAGDLDGDGDLDMAFLLQRETGGSGTFYYLVAALQNPDATAQGTNGLLAGDRIAPQSLEIKNGFILFTYAERKPDEPMTAQPSVGVSLYAMVSNGQLIRASAPTQ